MSLQWSHFRRPENDHFLLNRIYNYWIRYFWKSPWYLLQIASKRGLEMSRNWPKTYSGYGHILSIFIDFEVPGGSHIHIFMFFFGLQTNFPSPCVFLQTFPAKVCKYEVPSPNHYHDKICSAFFHTECRPRTFQIFHIDPIHEKKVEIFDHPWECNPENPQIWNPGSLYIINTQSLTPLNVRGDTYIYIYIYILTCCSIA